MGHFYSKNVSELANELFEATDTGVSIQDVVTAMKERSETVHAAEGEYTEDYMLSHGVEQLFFGLQEHVGCIVPEPESDEQHRILKLWDTDPFDFDEPEYVILDSIVWKQVQDEIPVIDYIPS